MSFINALVAEINKRMIETEHLIAVYIDSVPVAEDHDMAKVLELEMKRDSYKEFLEIIDDVNNGRL